MFVSKERRLERPNERMKYYSVLYDSLDFGVQVCPHTGRSSLPAVPLYSLYIMANYHQKIGRCFVGSTYSHGSCSISSDNMLIVAICISLRSLCGRMRPSRSNCCVAATVSFGRSVCMRTTKRRLFERCGSMVVIDTTVVTFRLCFEWEQILCQI